MQPNDILVFDLDNTLTFPGEKISKEMNTLINLACKYFTLGIITASSYNNTKRQLVDLHKYQYIFAESGSVFYHNGELIYQKSFCQFVEEEKLQKLINFALKELSNIDLPLKRGNFIEFRKGMINICPIGRNANIEERKIFVHGIRKKLVKKLIKQFGRENFSFLIGGQTSIDVFPSAQNKSLCIDELFQIKRFNNIYFFGDQIKKGEADHQIINDSRINGMPVSCPDDTMVKLKKLLKTVH
ncbi:hypothetical protein A3Q56_07164 [Intoshia linei]|uniref:Phosphomannomutase n=1 Tax=Intoshia linei TaxID=1819745 RepID=A0A177AT10_9BILA|nr:hypothetical protein A3Q56_07164 [Intoshia linei]